MSSLLSSVTCTLNFVPKTTPQKKKKKEVEEAVRETLDWFRAFKTVDPSIVTDNLTHIVETRQDYFWRPLHCNSPHSHLQKSPLSAPFSLFLWSHLPSIKPPSSHHGFPQHQTLISSNRERGSERERERSSGKGRWAQRKSWAWCAWGGRSTISSHQFRFPSQDPPCQWFSLVFPFPLTFHNCFPQFLFTYFLFLFLFLFLI